MGEHLEIEATEYESASLLYRACLLFAATWSSCSAKNLWMCGYLLPRDAGQATDSAVSQNS